MAVRDYFVGLLHKSLSKKKETPAERRGLPGIGYAANSRLPGNSFSATVDALNRVMNGAHFGTFGYAPLDVLANQLRDQRAALGAALAELDRQKI